MTPGQAGAAFVAAAAADWNSLPDDVLGSIGICVAELCSDFRDFICFATTSKRHKKLLLDCRISFSRIITRRIEILLSGIPEAFRGCLPNDTRLTKKLRSARDLHFFESFYKGVLCNCRNHNHSGGPGPMGPMAYVFHTISLKHMLSRFLGDFPSATVILDCHCRSYDDMDPVFALRLSKEIGCIAKLSFHDAIRDRVEVRAWGMVLGQEEPDPEHFLMLSFEGIFWIQIYVRLPRSRWPGGWGGAFLELPHRPGYYVDFVVPPVQDPPPLSAMPLLHRSATPGELSRR